MAARAQADQRRPDQMAAAAGSGDLSELFEGLGPALKPSPSGSSVSAAADVGMCR
jgi:hypothetical protein